MVRYEDDCIRKSLSIRMGIDNRSYIIVYDGYWP